jgi:probable O-glycosylation ligase (exosortase A-associated)
MISLRDLILALLLVGGLPVAIARPMYGVLIFAWLGIMNPHRLTWSFAENIPWSLMYSIATTIGFLTTKDRNLAGSLRDYWPVLLLLVWYGITTAFAFIPSAAQEKYATVLKSQYMCLLALALLTTRNRVYQLAIVMVVSLGFFGLKGGIFTIFTGGEDRVYGPRGSAIEDNNHLAVGLVMVLPLLYWLWHHVSNVWLRRLAVVAMLSCAAAILGSHSRSAFVGLIAIAGFLWLKTDRKLMTLILAIVIGTFGLVAMPGKYWERMETIVDHDEDASANSRLLTWKVATNVANSRPLGRRLRVLQPRGLRALFARTRPRAHRAQHLLPGTGRTRLAGPAAAAAGHCLYLDHLPPGHQAAQGRPRWQEPRAAGPDDPGQPDRICHRGRLRQYRQLGFLLLRTRARAGRPAGRTGRAGGPARPQTPVGRSQPTAVAAPEAAPHGPGIGHASEALR